MKLEVAQLKYKLLDVEAWLRRYQITKKSFAEFLDVSPQYLNDLCQGHRMVSEELSRKIEKFKLRIETK